MQIYNSKQLMDISDGEGKGSSENILLRQRVQWLETQLLSSQNKCESLESQYARMMDKMIEMEKEIEEMKTKQKKEKSVEEVKLVHQRSIDCLRRVNKEEPVTFDNEKRRGRIGSILVPDGVGMKSSVASMHPGVRVEPSFQNKVKRLGLMGFEGARERLEAKQGPELSRKYSIDCRDPHSYFGLNAGKLDKLLIGKEVKKEVSSISMLRSRNDKLTDKLDGIISRNKKGLSSRWEDNQPIGDLWG